MRSLLSKIIWFLLLVVFGTVLSEKDIHIRVIDFMNHKREAFDLPQLSRDESLQTDAENYAKHLASLNIKDQVLHEYAKTYDEHLEIDHSEYPQSDCQNTKYTEVIFEFEDQRYSFAVNYFSVMGYDLYTKTKKSKVQKSIVDKFTAIFWKSSKHAGVGIYPKNPSNPNGRNIMVIRLTPPGNQKGGYAKNINKMYRFVFGDLLDISTKSGVSNHKLNGVLALNVIISSVFPILVKYMF